MEVRKLIIRGKTKVEEIATKEEEGVIQGGMIGKKEERRAIMQYDMIIEKQKKTQMGEKLGIILGQKMSIQKKMIGKKEETRVIMQYGMIIEKKKI